MRVTRVRAVNFRNYAKADLAPCPGVTALYGDNAQGKTALLEAVMLASLGRSHRTPRDRELVKWGEEGGRVDVDVERPDGAREVTIKLYQDKRKAAFINGGAINRASELMGHVCCVLFAPEHLRIVKDGPVERRRFIDMELSQLNPVYFAHLQEYARALLQRNALLRDIGRAPSLSEQLPAWDEQIARHGAYIIEARRAFAAKLAPAAEARHGELSGGRELLRVSYAPSLSSEAEGEALIGEFADALARDRNAEIRRQTTLTGPHRDDLTLEIGGVDARAYGSQGQQRTAALALKLAELEVMREALGQWPVLMLDDVMSELDPGRRRQLINRLDGVQAIVTCTDLDDLSGASIGMARRVREGTLEA